MSVRAKRLQRRGELGRFCRGRQGRGPAMAERAAGTWPKELGGTVPVGRDRVGQLLGEGDPSGPSPFSVRLRCEKKRVMTTPSRKSPSRARAARRARARARAPGSGSPRRAAAGRRRRSAGSRRSRGATRPARGSTGCSPGRRARAPPRRGGRARSARVLDRHALDRLAALRLDHRARDRVQAAAVEVAEDVDRELLARAAPPARTSRPGV